MLLKMELAIGIRILWSVRHERIQYSHKFISTHENPKCSKWWSYCHHSKANGRGLLSDGSHEIYVFSFIACFRLDPSDLRHKFNWNRILPGDKMEWRLRGGQWAFYCDIHMSSHGSVGFNFDYLLILTLYGACTILTDIGAHWNLR